MRDGCAWSLYIVVFGQSERDCMSGRGIPGLAGLSRLYDCTHPAKLAPHIKVAITDGHLLRYCVICGRYNIFVSSSSCWVTH